MPASPIFSGTWKWGVSPKMMVIEVITFCLAGYSVQSWSRPPRGTGALLLEGRQRASMSRLWGHSEYSDPSDWSLEYPVSTESRGRERKDRMKERKPRLWGSGVNGDWGINERQIGADRDPQCHTFNCSDTEYTRSHKESFAWAVDELSVKLSVWVTTGINNPTGPGGSDIVDEGFASACTCFWVYVCVLLIEETSPVFQIPEPFQVFLPPLCYLLCGLLSSKITFQYM